MIFTLLGSGHSNLLGRTCRRKRDISGVVLLLSLAVQAVLCLACNNSTRNRDIGVKAKPAPKIEPCDTAAVLKTPALYLLHIGDEDKPIEPIVLVPGTGRPTTSEFQCAAPITFTSPDRHMYTVTDEEFGNAVKVLDDSKNTKLHADGSEYRYVVVRGAGAVRIGSLDRDQAKSIFATLETYFKERELQVYAALRGADKLF